MKGNYIGYRRVSSSDQNPDRQLKFKHEKEQIEYDKIFTDYCSGKNLKRPELENMILFLREGDILYVHSLDRLGRNLRDLQNLLNKLLEKNVTVRFITENITYSNDSSPMSIFQTNLMSAFADFERSMIKERQREGIELAKKRGVYKGRKPALNQTQINELVERAAKGENKSALAREFNVSRETVYKYIREANT